MTFCNGLVHPKFPGKYFDPSSHFNIKNLLCIGASIRIRQESHCPPYCGFVLLCVLMSLIHLKVASLASNRKRENSWSGL